MKQTLPLLVLSSLLAAGSSQAAVNVTLSQVGSDVVLTGGGTLNITDLTMGGTEFNGAVIVSSWAGFLTGPEQNYISLTSVDLTGPDNFGSVITNFVSGIGSGDFFGAQGSGEGVGYALFVPVDYVSGESLNSTSTFANTTLADIGLATGTYVWMWGAGLNADSLTVTVVPEPSTYALVGLAGLAGLVVLRRRKK